MSTPGSLGGSEKVLSGVVAIIFTMCWEFGFVYTTSVFFQQGRQGYLHFTYQETNVQRV